MSMIKSAGRLRLVVVLFLIVALAEWIGPARFSAGPGKVVLLPMLWALLIAAGWGMFHRRLPRAMAIDAASQSLAAGLLNAGLLMLVVKLSLTVGVALPAIRQAGWALLFQEFGHALGTLALGLPLALVLGVKREAVGATFSVGREGNIVIIGQKYGIDSPEGRGVLAEYITGTVLGALFIAILAGIISSLNVFHPQALAMGAGVGSSSMMMAAAGAIVGHYPDQAEGIMAIAAASNLVTLVLGFYFTLFLSLPLCSWLYDRLEPVLGRFSRRAVAGPAIRAQPALPGHGLSIGDTVLSWIVLGGGVVIGNLLSYKVPALVSLKGVLVVAAMVAVAELVKRLMPRVPLLLTLSIAVTAIGVPGLFPFSNVVIELTSPLNFMAFTTPVLALAGFSVARDLPIFRQLGWRIVAVSLTATAGTFLGATVIAQLFH